MICRYRPFTRRVIRRMKWKELPDGRWFRVIDRWLSYEYKLEGADLYQRSKKFGEVVPIFGEGRASYYLNLECELV